MISKIFDSVIRNSPTARRLYSKFWYQYISKVLKDEPVIFLNYGYADFNSGGEQIELQEADEPNRFHIQLYHHVASAIDLHGLDVLEIGCGRGGGAAYIMQYLKPKSMLGIDVSKKAIEFCNSHYSIEGLFFTQGDAESLQFEDNTFDVVINLESSHCYGDMGQFLSEVFRVLRPEGCFLFADLNNKAIIDAIREQLMHSGLEIIKEERINANVVKAMELESEKRLVLTKQFMPKIFHEVFKQFVGVKGSRVYQTLISGDRVYMNYVLRKRNTVQPAQFNQ